MALAGLAVVGGLVGVVVATSGGGDRLTVFTARSHYGDERPFQDFAKDEGIDLTLFGGSAPELYERLKSEGEETKADVLITVDAANLWRAQEAGLIEEWKGLTYRARTIMRSTERVEEADATAYEDLGDPRWKGKLCLRSGTSEYNVSFVADRIAKDGDRATRRMLERWMDNDPEILGSDVDVLNAIADGRCDVGLTNTYYLGRELAEDGDFPVAPVWADQQDRGTHVNLSGVGVARASDSRSDAEELVRYLTAPRQQRTFARNNHEFGVTPEVKTTPEIARFGDFKRDPIDVAGAGRRLDDAVRMMNDVGWD